ncbi:MAG: DUF362 domain-containing protein [Bacillota bacterium]|nr:DUF362 domain-containing protein [Bacillota bacterium]
MAIPSVPTKISLVKAENRRDALRQSIKLLDINPVQDKNVVIKPNFNTADPYPGSTHLATLRELIILLQEMGAKKITIGERSGPVNSAEVLDMLGVPYMAKELGVEVINFDELPAEELLKIDPPGSHWENGFMVPKMLREAECIVATPCLKTHQYGGVFTMALKLAVGIVPKTGNRYMNELHGSKHMRKMIAEISSAYSPDLYVLDGMEAFVAGGPMTGKTREPGLFITGTDPIAIDAVGIAILK